MKLRATTPRYFDGKISHGFVSLFTSRSLTNIAAGFFGIFLPIFLFNLLGQDIRNVALYYASSSLLYFVGLPLFIRYMNRYGFRRALQTSTFLGAGYYLLLYFINSQNAKFILPLMVLAIATWRIFYWVPYHVDFTKFSGKRNKGRGVGLMEATLGIIGVITPILAGFIITRFSYDVLFFLGVFLYLLSLIPFLTIPHTKEKFSWNLKKTWQQFFKKEHQKTLVSFVAIGAETSIGGIVWPIFILLLLKGDLLKVGMISTLVVGVTVVLQVSIGKIIDKKWKKKRVLKYGSLFCALGWLLKIFIGTSFQLFLIDSFHKLTNVFFKVPFDSVTYEIAADQGHYMDEFTVLKEMSIALGRVLACSAIVIGATFFSLEWLFLLGSLSALTFNFIQRQDSYATR